jgi:hypothetical protein
VKLGLIISSIIYKVFKDGIAINTSIIAGRAVQKNSISSAPKKNRLKLLVEIALNKLYKTIVVILIKIIIAWSWKKIKCSIRGEFLF